MSKEESDLFDVNPDESSSSSSSSSSSTSSFQVVNKRKKNKTNNNNKNSKDSPKFAYGINLGSEEEKSYFNKIGCHPTQITHVSSSGTHIQAVFDRKIEQLEKNNYNKEVKLMQQKKIHIYKVAVLLVGSVDYSKQQAIEEIKSILNKPNNSKYTNKQQQQKKQIEYDFIGCHQVCGGENIQCKQDVWAVTSVNKFPAYKSGHRFIPYSFFKQNDFYYLAALNDANKSRLKKKEEIAKANRQKLAQEKKAKAVEEANQRRIKAGKTLLKRKEKEEAAALKKKEREEAAALKKKEKEEAAELKKKEKEEAAELKQKEKEQQEQEKELKKRQKSIEKKEMIAQHVNKYNFTSLKEVGMFADTEKNAFNIAAPIINADKFKSPSRRKRKRTNSEFFNKLPSTHERLDSFNSVDIPQTKRRMRSNSHSKEALAKLNVD